SRQELMRRVGSLAQIAGIDLMTFGEGHARGVRALDIRTGSGFRFSVMPDRGMDVGPADFQGTGLCWLPPKQLAGPWFYDGDQDDHAWLRVGLGGLFNTAGLVSIGPPQTISTQQYGFTQRLAARYGTHDRIALTPASRFNYGESWQGDRCLLWVEGIVQQDIAYGENLTLTRRYETEIGASSFSLIDVVRNDGYFSTPHQLLYHFNIGFPVVDDGSEILAAVTEEPASIAFSTQGASSSNTWRTGTAPQVGFTYEGYNVSMRAGPDGKVGVAIINRRLRPELGGLGVFLRYNHGSLPDYIAWRMMREGLYAMGMEPATNRFGEVPQLINSGYPIMLEPGETRAYELVFGILIGGSAIDAFAASLDVG
ncbi:MAG: aldose 1-epimerase family protein, partial [Chloroflexota bacterium]|nr:aldose 1-epimerase family protein [Chloroflexota bacterium]